MEGRVRQTRRVVTALFADLVGSTALGEELDPEDFQEIVEGAVTAMAGPIDKLGGTVKEVAGDGVLALFGALSVHEDDAERAVLAGLGIVDAVAAYAEEVAGRWGIEGLAVRIGIESGLAVLGPSRSVGSAYEARGDCLNTAARLQSQAGPGEVLVGPSTVRLVEPLFEWASPRELTLKGKAEIVVARAPLRRRVGAERRRAPEGMEAPMVGRKRELELTEEAVGELLSSRGGVLMVIGEAGIGKTRFARELRRRLDSQAGEGVAPAWLEGRCLSYGTSAPYLPFQGVIRSWLASEEGPGSRGEAGEIGLIRRRGEGLLGERAAALVPFLASLLGIELPAQERAAIDRLSPEARQQRTSEAALALVEGLGARGPTVVAFEDLQWADAASLGLIRRLIAGAQTAGVLFVLTLRPEQASAAWRLRTSIGDDPPPGMKEVVLGRLGEGAESDLLHALVGEAVLPQQLERELVERSEGNPFFLEELVRSLVDAGALVRGGRGWRFEREATIEIPETIEKVILARIDGLPAAAADALGAAAVLGRQFDAGAVGEMLGADASGALHELERHELLRADGAAADYRFRHSLIREAVYNSLLRRRRRELHSRAAEILEARLADASEEDRGIVAHHYAAAGQPERALPRYAGAARAARRIYAPDEAIRHYSAALALAEEVEEVDLAELARLHHERGMVHWEAGHHPEATRDCRLALEAARQAGERSLELEVLNDLGFIIRASDFEGAVGHHSDALEIARELGDAAAEVRVLNRLSLLYSNRLRFDWAVELAERALALARPLDDDRTLARAIDAIKLAAHQLGELPRLERSAAELAEIHRRRGDLWYLQWPLLERALVPIAAARWEEAEARLAEAEELSERFGGTLGVNLEEARSRIELGRGSYGRALEVAGRLEVWVGIGSQAGFEEWIGWAQASRGSILLETGSPVEAAGCLEQGLRSAEKAGALNPMLRCSAQLALALRRSGDPAGSSAAVKRAEGLLEAITTPPGRTWLWGAVAHLSLARIYLLDGMATRASEVLTPLRDSARAAGWRELLCRSATLLARSRGLAGDAAGARALLRDALDAAPEERLPAAALGVHAQLALVEADSGDAEACARHRSKAEGLGARLAATIGDPARRDRYRRDLDRQLGTMA